jgi:hypothetical protein
LGDTYFCVATVIAMNEPAQKTNDNCGSGCGVSRRQLCLRRRTMRVEKNHSDSEDY